MESFALKLLQAIPSGPDFAVTIVLIGGLLTLVLHGVSKLIRTVRENRRDEHERIGTRKSDDIKVDRAKIEEELNVARMLDENYENILQLVKDNVTFSQVLTRLTENLEAMKRSNELNTGLLDVAVKKTEILAVQVQSLMTAAAAKDEFKELRHGVANYRQEIADIVEYVRGMKKSPV